MIGASSPVLIGESHIRKLDLAKDLDQVADLIERCFPIHTDRDGQTYIKEMRKAAREMRYLGWLSSFADLNGNKVPGFIWQEEGRIIGNISLIPFKDQGKTVYLIANVAVAPEHRRNGIARALTNHALAFLRRSHVSQVWLQVRDDNPSAYRLYRSTGFKDHTVRSTWRIKPGEFHFPEGISQEAIKISHRHKAVWEDQNRWLLQNYPAALRWNLPVHFRRFEPGILQNIVNFVDGIHLRHWQVMACDELQGIITWQKTDSYANNLWLALPEEVEKKVLAIALQQVMMQLPKKHPIAIDYPKGRFEDEFQAMGFNCFRSLIWMRQNL